eukprot:m.773632 g.773632  ORF g.773632 m.773632 type:complete len:74 (-) comp23253_c0_seq14:444-665(-)
MNVLFSQQYFDTLVGPRAALAARMGSLTDSVDDAPPMMNSDNGENPLDQPMYTSATRAYFCRSIHARPRCLMQ